MTRILKFTALAVLAITAVSSMAQQQGGGQGGGGGRQGRGGGMQRMMRGGMGQSSLQLLQRDDVREDLAVTDEQKDKISDLQKGQRDKMREAFQGMGGGGGQRPDMSQMRTVMEKINKENDAEVAKILTEAQNKRLREIKIQMAGKRAASWDDVATDLGLSADQKTKLKSLVEKADAANMALFGRLQSQFNQNGDMTMEQVQAAVETNGKTLDTEIDKILTDAQKAKLTELEGKKFEEKDQPRGGFGFGGGRGGNRRGGQ